MTFYIAFCKSDLVTGHAEIKFHGCRGFYADVDLLAKRLCGDQIASAYCVDAEKSQTAFVKRLNDRFDLYRGESMSGLFIFWRDAHSPDRSTDRSHASVLEKIVA